MIRLLDTLVARLLLVSLLGISLVHVASLWTFEQALHRELTTAQDSGLTDRLLSIRRSVLAAPEVHREKLAHDLSGGAIEAHWTRSKGAVAGGPGAEMWEGLAAQLRSTGNGLVAKDVVIGTTSDPHIALLSLRLPDDSWLNFNLFTAGRGRTSSHGTMLSTTLMAIGVALLALLIAGWLARPLRRMADAVTTLSPEDPRSEVAESGPREVRQLAAAFNDMRLRIADLITRRTHALAAVSHDLRTPLTRLKLRLGDVESADLQHAMETDIDEMEQMIEATLSYLRGNEKTEAVRPVDIVAVLKTIVDNARDLGREAELFAPHHVVVHGRILGLKRAMTNLIGNSLRFGTKVRVEVKSTADHVLVTIADDGPGIPPDKLQVVTEPFVRLEESRNVETGGVGLGLTIAKANVDADGGTLMLQNGPRGGLNVMVRLPRASEARYSA